MALAVASVAVARRDGDPRLVRIVVERPGLCWLGAAAFVALTALLRPARSVRHRRGRSPPSSRSPRPWPRSLWAPSCTRCCVAPAVFGDHAGGLPRRVLAAAPLAWLGLVSYGVYLWHLTIAELLAAAGDRGHFRADGLDLVGRSTTSTPRSCSRRPSPSAPRSRLRATTWSSCRSCGSRSATLIPRPPARICAGRRCRTRRGPKRTCLRHGAPSRTRRLRRRGARAGGLRGRGISTRGAAGVQRVRPRQSVASPRQPPDDEPAQVVVGARAGHPAREVERGAALPVCHEHQGDHGTVARVAAALGRCRGRRRPAGSADRGRPPS